MRRAIQAQALRLFAAKGFQATTIEDIATAAEMAPRTFFRYFPTKEEVVFWSEYPPMLAEFVAARPDDEPALEALRHGIVEGLAANWDQDEERERLLERLRLAFRTPALHPRMRQQQAHWAAELAEILADRLDERPDNLQVRIIAAAVAAAVWVAAEEWQAQDDGEGDLGALIDQALGTVLDAPMRATPTPSTR
jgi:AcrR family transcriptional regulator